MIKQSDRKGWWYAIETDGGATYYLRTSLPLLNVLESPNAAEEKDAAYLGNNHGKRILIAGAKVRIHRGCQEIFEGEKIAIGPKINSTP